MRVVILYSKQLKFHDSIPTILLDEYTKVWEGNVSGVDEEFVANRLWAIFNGFSDKDKSLCTEFIAHAERVSHERHTDHTSMSVGDVISFPDSNVFLKCASTGWVRCVQSQVETV